MQKIHRQLTLFFLTVLLSFIGGGLLMPMTSLAQNGRAVVQPHNCGKKVTPRQITFADKTWNVKYGKNTGPNLNEFSDWNRSVWVDDKGYLHLRMRRQITPEGKTIWWSAEVCEADVTDYGMFRFEVSGWVDRLNPNVVLGLFLYEATNEGKVDEIDIELARWSNPSARNGQFALQPYYNQGNLKRFRFALTNPTSTHYFDWCPEAIQFKSINGFRAEPSVPAQLFNEWVYTGADNPLASVPLRIHMNLWMTDTPDFKPTAKEIKNGIEVVIRRLTVDHTPNVPAITLPDNGADVSSQPSFVWDDTDAANAYTFQLTTAADTAFATPLINEALLPSENAVTLSFTPETPLTPGDYLWRVSSFCGAATSDWSETRTITVAAEE